MASVPVFCRDFWAERKKPGRGRTIWNARRVRFAHKQRKNYFKFAMPENLRIFRNCLFTGGDAAGNGSCRACFLRKQPRGGSLLRLTAFASSPERGSFLR